MAISSCHSASFLPSWSNATQVSLRLFLSSFRRAARSVPGWAMYCSTKAALDRFTAVTAEDQQGKPNPARLSAVAPGVVNTDMQGSIRASSKEDFPNVDRFIDLEKDGKLQSPEDTAKRLLNYLNSDEFGKEPISDIRNISVGD